jgi:hypothetical protein
MLFWLILFLIVAALSFFLAKRSVKSAETKIKIPEEPRSLFLIRSPLAVDETLLQKIHQHLLEEKTVLSFERLYKGNESVLTVYGPQNLATQYPELNLLELEDYLVPKERTFEVKEGNKINADQAFIWNVALKPGLDQGSLLSDLELKDDEHFFFQLVLQAIPDRKELTNQFKVTSRAMAATKDKLQKVQLAKRIFADLNEKLGINSNAQVTPQSFDKYQIRLSEGDNQIDIPDLLKIL